MLNTCKDWLCYLYIYLISDTCTIITQICHKVTQEEVCLHITISSSLSHSSTLLTWPISANHCLAEMHITDHPCWSCTKERRAECRCQTVIEHHCQSCDTRIRRVRYQHCCGRSWDMVMIVVMRCAKHGYRIPPAIIFFFAISAQNVSTRLSAE